MAKIEIIMDELRKDLGRWKEDLALLRTEGKDDVAATVEKWIEQGERILARWDHHPDSAK